MPQYDLNLFAKFLISTLTEADFLNLRVKSSCINSHMQAQTVVILSSVESIVLPAKKSDLEYISQKHIEAL